MILRVQVRRKDEANRTDMVRATVGFGSGVHVWEITWPRASRGTHAVIGVATTRALLVCSGKLSITSLDWLPVVLAYCVCFLEVIQRVDR